MFVSWAWISARNHTYTTWSVNTESAWSEDAASVYYSSTALLHLVQRVKMTTANEKWTSEVKRCKSNEKLMTKWEAKSKWNINVNISIKTQHLPNKFRHDGDARPLLHENAIIMWKRRLIKYQTHAWTSPEPEALKSPCLIAGVFRRSLFPCLSACQSLSCQTRAYRNNPRFHSNGPVTRMWTRWDRTALAGLLRHKPLLLCFSSSAFNMQFKNIYEFSGVIKACTHYPVTTAFIPVWFMSRPWESSMKIITFFFFLHFG